MEAVIVWVIIFRPLDFVVYFQRDTIIHNKHLTDLVSLVCTVSYNTLLFSIQSGVLLEAGTRVPAPVSSEHSTRLPRNEVSSRQTRNQKLD